MCNIKNALLTPLVKEWMKSDIALTTGSLTMSMILAAGLMAWRAAGVPGVTKYFGVFSIATWSDLASENCDRYQATPWE